MINIWTGAGMMGGIDDEVRVNAAAAGRMSNMENMSLGAQEEVRQLRKQLARLTLLNQAMWELVRDRANLTDADLERMADEIDARDGSADGQLGGNAVTCPTCHRVSNAKHHQCLYCGELFAKDVYG